MSMHRYIGLMSGTSLDGIDGVIVEFDANGTPSIVSTHFLAFAPAFSQELLALNTAGHDELQRCASAATELARLYASVVHVLLASSGLDASSITAIGCHGQTVRHRPDLGFTVQIVNAPLLAELTRISVVSDFRSRDIAAGGQGAPLVPAFHHAIFASPHRHRAILNIGGISNITDLPTDAPVRGFDCGPGNMLMDAWAFRNLHQPFDRNGDWAATGTVIPELLVNLLQHPFFSITPPKSTGRDDFHLGWLTSLLSPAMDAACVQATLLEFTAMCIVNDINSYCSGAQEIFVCGGGAHNAHLLNRLARMMPDTIIDLTDTLHIPADWVEAVAFAWLARQTDLRLPGNIPHVTGAHGPRILGAIYPA